MDSGRISALATLEILETGQPRRWSEEEKIRIVSESLAGRGWQRLVATTFSRAASPVAARCYGTIQSGMQRVLCGCDRR
jgi:transposase-like protein